MKTRGSNTGQGTRVFFSGDVGDRNETRERPDVNCRDDRSLDDDGIGDGEHNH